MGEFHDVLNDLKNAGDDKAKMWNSEMRFYASGFGGIVCRCNGAEVFCGDDFRANSMLICTKLTRTARANIMQTISEGKIYLVTGPAGTGKTETVKDTFRMLG